MKNIIFMMIFVLLISGCSQNTTPSQTNQVTILAASSLHLILEDVKTEIEEDTNIDIKILYGSSTQLKTHILRGQEFDLFVSASEWDMDELVNKGYISERYLEPLIYNDLVFISNNDIADLKHLAEELQQGEIDFIALGEPNSVPLGKYTYDYLSNIDMWDLFNENSVYGKDAQQVFNYVNNKQAQAGVVYGSDPRMRQLDYISTDYYISYQMGINQDRDDKIENQVIFEHLLSEKWQELFQDYGFISR
ncbi:molybdate ABC transporter substrate-binding protein [Alkalibacillus aidingensis]|uniref:molybdate ABC transporter substrate-binding protein n=1 Tax=Alkalibacillus aidingensis TaxID=2747607 RepID=UPI0016604648|nr:molybdate ABC transporter substrate-binding protein [Alkalibacillus aidingensis]